MATQADTERIVSEVLRRLAVPRNGTPSETSPPAACLRIGEAVVSLATVEGRLANVRQVVIAPEAVVTPSVRDLLRQSKIELLRDNSPSSTPNSCRQRLVVANLSSINIKPVLTDVPCEIRQLKSDSLPATIATLVTELRRQETLGVIFADVPEVAVCLANRNAVIRAVHGWSKRIVKRAVTTIAANLLVIEPQLTADFETRMLLNTFVQTPRQHDIKLPAGLA